MGSLEQAWRAIDSMRDSNAKTVERVVKLESRADSFDRLHNETLQQLRFTEDRMCELMDDKHAENQKLLNGILIDIKALMAEYNQAKGRSQAVNWFPTAINVVTGLGTISGMIWAVGKISGIQ